LLPLVTPHPAAQRHVGRPAWRQERQREGAMMDIEVYTFENKYGDEDTYHTQNANDAREYAQKYNLRWIANTFVWDDSELVEDYTERDDDEEEEA
jgi:hypothetical protein